MPQVHRIKQIILKNNTLQKYSEIVVINFSKLVFLSAPVVYFQCLYFPHSLIIEFRGKHAIKQLPRVLPDLYTSLLSSRIQTTGFIKSKMFQAKSKYRTKQYHEESLKQSSRLSRSTAVNFFEAMARTGYLTDVKPKERHFYVQLNVMP